MHGDFEAQRHWMELTAHLPMRSWYFHDLQWWGLDYPPLTAYHSWLCGKMYPPPHASNLSFPANMLTSGSLINPTWFALQTSRKLENYHLKLYMRSTAVLSEYFIYIPSLLLLIRSYSALPTTKMSKYDTAIATTAILLQPALILIDHGHFQYNSVMLGLSVASLAMFLRDHIYWGSFFFVLSLGFKQMALYYAPAIFAYLLGLCIFPRPNLLRLITIGITTIASFAILIFPLFVTGGAPVIAQVLYRCFPFSRGLWEDKVANLWCALNPIIKFRQLFTTQTLQHLSLATTLVTVLPPCALLCLYPRKENLLLGLAGCAWGFFLCSFQVHEKSVLLPLMPTTLLLAQGVDRDTVAWVGWVNTIANFSMWPLLKRDGLGLQYTVMTAFWAWLMGLGGEWGLPTNNISKVVQLVGYASVLGLHVFELVIDSSAMGLFGAVGDKVQVVLRRYPDLVVVLNVALCFFAFAWMYGWTLLRLWKSTVAERDPKKKKE